MSRDFWPIPRDWDGQTVAILAGGPSLTHDQVWQVLGAGIKVATINSSFSLVPSADIHYFCDGRWLDHNEAEFFAAKGPTTLKVTIDENSKRKHPDLKLVQNLGFKRDNPAWTGLPPDPRQIFHGHNSGYQLLSIVAKRGAKRVLLLGYDMKHTDKTHWHGGHSFRKSDPTTYGRNMIPALETLAPHLAEYGCQVINCTPDSALHCFEKMDLCHALSAPSAIYHITDARLL